MRLFVSIFVMSACSGTITAQTPVAIPQGPHQARAREIFKELIEIRSGVTTGNITLAAQAMAARFREAGIPDQDIFVGGPRPEKHNVVARLRTSGSTTTKPLLLLAHLDVVEALKEDWSPDLDPFVFTERDGYYYGRGTVDDKAMAAIFVANVFRLKQERFQPGRDIIIALTADEEGGAFNGTDWLLKEHPELLDAGLVINEGGGGVVRDGKYVMHTVQAAEKVTTNFTFRVINRGGHSSAPRDDNAITTLATALGRLARHRFPIQFNEVTRSYFTHMAAVERSELGQAMKALVANPNDSVALAMVATHPGYNATLRTTCVATRLKGGHATNALPQLAEANINCRLYPTDTAAGIRDALAALVADTSVQVLIASQRPATPPSPLQADVIDAVRQTTRELFGDLPIVPSMSAGGTDSRFFRARGIPAFGVSGIFMDQASSGRSHGRDERIPIRAFYEGQEFLYRLTKRLAARSGGR